MHVIFLNPQGNFDRRDSFWAAHPDFGGQLIYVKETALAMARMGVKVDIVTRQIDDPDWPGFSEPEDRYDGFPDNPRILRFPCGGPGFLQKELLWDHLNEWAEHIADFYEDSPPDFATGHYGDGGYAAVLLWQKMGVPFSLTGHSLGAQKLDKLGMTSDNFEEMNEQYNFSTRIEGERQTMINASLIVTSTNQERYEQYGHPLYQTAISVEAPKFHVIPPGVNTRVFNTNPAGGDEARTAADIQAALGDGDKPCVILASRLETKKNHIGVFEAFAASAELRERADLVVVLRGVPDPWSDIGKLGAEEQDVLRPLLETAVRGGFKDALKFLDLRSQHALASAYRHLSRRGSVFCLTAFYEPFGLAPIEAAACGLAQVVTKNGGPSEIFEDGSAVLVDPYDPADIARGLLEGLENHAELARKGERRVLEHYTWDRTAARYLEAIEDSLRERALDTELNGEDRLQAYLDGEQEP
ncbi:MAG: glycosyltransferase [Alphaproteobacteria bacterium]|nr:glycosyltransferase [Alphaproteobacteria bacterium]